MMPGFSGGGRGNEVQERGRTRDGGQIRGVDVDEVPLEGAERISPADRIEADGLETCDYLVYPVEAALADKLCGIAKFTEGERPPG